MHCLRLRASAAPVSTPPRSWVPSAASCVRARRPELSSAQERITPAPPPAQPPAPPHPSRCCCPSPPARLTTQVLPPQLAARLTTQVRLPQPAALCSSLAPSQPSRPPASCCPLTAFPSAPASKPARPSAASPLSSPHSPRRLSQAPSGLTPERLLPALTAALCLPSPWLARWLWLCWAVGGLHAAASALTHQCLLPQWPLRAPQLAMRARPQLPVLGSEPRSQPSSKLVGPQLCLASVRVRQPAGSTKALGTSAGRNRTSPQRLQAPPKAPFLTSEVASAVCSLSMGCVAVCSSGNLLASSWVCVGGQRRA